MSRDEIRKSMDVLFPQGQVVVLNCIECDWSEQGAPVAGAVTAASVGDTCPECESYVHISGATDRCRVCQEPVVDGRWNYCSERCRNIANAVQRMFIWDRVREQVLNRDDYTCQRCGWSKQHISRVKSAVDYEWVRDETEYDGVNAFHRGIPGLEVDHITRLADDGHPFDESNLQTLCERCHREKTAAENSDTAGGSNAAASARLEEYL